MERYLFREWNPSAQLQEWWMLEETSQMLEVPGLFGGLNNK